MAISVVELDKETWFKIPNHDSIRPFFMNVVSDSNHWMFISSNGGLTAGRKNPEFALFPYYTDDKLTELADTTGSKTIFQVLINGSIHVWEPFSERFTNQYKITRNLYKNSHGNKVMFEEENHDLGLTFKYQWNSSNLFGFVKKSELINTSDSDLEITLLDGIQNIMPFGVASDLQATTSNLVDGYKRSELVKESGLGIFALSAIIVDKAEPSEALKANIAWSLGLENVQYLLSSTQLKAFRNKGSVKAEYDVKGEKGAYFVNTHISLSAGTSEKWKLIANVNHNHSQVVSLNKSINEVSKLSEIIDENIEEGTHKLLELTGGADSLQFTSDQLKDSRHYSNVLFNIMRGGTFDKNYTIEKPDFVQYLSKANVEVLSRNQDFVGSLKETFNSSTLYALLEETKDVDLIRLCKEYLPLKFSRRHGDPSRPWNKFSINTNSEIDGSKILDYEGNWRDIFQNWEALVHSYPGFIEGMIFKFLNATTFDGYNPYRVTKGGFDWETIEPDNPWSYIGYWGDHQIIYLLKFLEFYQEYKPKALVELFDKEYFTYANVPYRIKGYDKIAEDPKNTIDFDERSEHEIQRKIQKIGADGALLESSLNKIHHVNFLEKILATVLAKVSNFIPEGGIWMNTQRPEWNDANNALVGNGVSMVTLCYLRRFLKFFDTILENNNVKIIAISSELRELFNQLSSILVANEHILNSNIDNKSRKIITDSLGIAGSDFRINVYNNGFSGKRESLSLGEIKKFTQTTLRYLEHTIKANKREDNLYHAYNLMSFKNDGVVVSHLSEMLEGQVAAISSKFLDSEEILRVLDALKESALYRKDQSSYILYPNKELPGFLSKNNIPKESVEKSDLLKALVKANNLQIINKDVKESYHFNGNFKNNSDLKVALDSLEKTEFKSLAQKERSLVLDIFEEVFDHKSFTGRSGTFFAYEGLGSIYWHMVSKLHLAVNEACKTAIQNEVSDTVLKPLLKHHEEIGEGIGVHKSPEVYGAFPTDPYSHTPQHRGAQQPGMTGQVKEDILVRFGELGVQIRNGILAFDPSMLKKDEFVTESHSFDFINVFQETEQVALEPKSLFFTYCQVPIIYKLSENQSIDVEFKNGTSKSFQHLSLDQTISDLIFHRTGEVKKITVFTNDSSLSHA